MTLGLGLNVASAAVAVRPPFVTAAARPHERRTTTQRHAPDPVATLREVAGLIVRCSIVLAEGWSNTNRADLAALDDAPEARNLISISEYSWPSSPTPAP